MPPRKYQNITKDLPMENIPETHEAFEEDAPYVPGEPLIDGADIFFSQNQQNQNFVETFFTTTTQGALDYKNFMPINPNDMGRLYRFDPETGHMVRDFYNPELNESFADDPKSFYEMMDSHDLSAIWTKKKGDVPQYFYFDAGSSKPLYICDRTTFELEDGTIPEDSPVRAALQEVVQERAQMSEEDRKREKEQREAQNLLYSCRRVAYVNDMILGSKISEHRGTDVHRNFSEAINQLISEENPSTDFDYHVPNGSLSEEDMIAMTMLSFGNPEITGTYYEGSNKLYNAAEITGMWPQDFAIERNGKVGSMLIPLKSSRLDAKKHIEEYDATGDKNILADAVLNGIVANSMILRNPNYISFRYIGNGETVEILNRFLKKPWLKELVLLKAEAQGRLAEIEEAYSSIQTITSIVDASKEKNACLLHSVDANGQKDPEYARTAAVDDTILKLTAYEYTIATSQMAGIQSPAEAAEEAKFKKRLAEAEKLDNPDRKKEKLKATKEFGPDMQGALKLRPQPGLALLLGQPGGKDALYKYLNENNIVLNADSTQEQIAEIHAKLEDAHLIPKMPSAFTEKDVKGYWDELKKYEPGRVVANITRDFEPGFNPENETSKDMRKLETKDAESNQIARDLNSEVSAPVPEIGYEGIVYDKAAVKEELDNFKLDHPQASEKEIEEKERSLIGREAVIAVNSALLKKEDPNVTDVAVEMLEVAERRQIAQGDMDLVTEYFTTMHKGDDFAEQLRNYQAIAMNMDSRAEYRQFVKNSLEAILLNTKTDNYSQYLNYGVVHHKAFFAPVTDSSELFMDVKMDDKVTSARHIMEDYQRDIDSVKIDVPDYLSPELMEYVVLGECLRPEQILPLKDMAYGPGSTIPKQMDPLSNLRIFYFDNLLGNDSRLNTQCFRSIVADSRRKVAGFIDQDNREELTECLKTSVSAMYNEMMESIDNEKGMFRYMVTNVTRIRDLAVEKHIPLDTIGLDDKKLRNLKVMQLRLEFGEKRNALKEELNSKRMAFALNKELPDSLNPRKSRKFYDMCLDAAAYYYLNSQINNEVSAMKSDVYGTSDPKLHEVANRPLTPTEQLMLKDPQALFEYYRMKALDSEYYKNLMEDPKSAVPKVLSSGGPNELHSFEYIKAPRAFEQYGADQLLKRLHEEADKHLKILNDTPEDTVEEEDGPSFRNAKVWLKEISKAAEELQKKRAKIKDLQSDKNLHDMIPEYEHIALLMKGFSANVYDPYTDFITDYGNAIQTGIDSQIAAVKELDEQEKFLTERADIVSEFSNEGKTLFERNFDRTKAALDLCTNGKANNPKIWKMLNDLTLLKVKIEDARSKDTEKDMASVSSAFRNALGSVNECLEDKKLDKDLRFVAEGLQKSLKEDVKLVDDAAQDHRLGKTYDQVIIDARNKDYTEKLNDQTARLQELKQNLESWKSRFGGNSPAFAEFYKKFRDMQVDENNSAWTPDKKVIEELSKAAKDYIDQKKYIPGTDKGKTRLAIIKEVRDICENMKPQLNYQVIDEAREKAFTPKPPQEVLAEKMQGYVEKISKAIECHSTGALLESMSALVYMQGLDEHKDEMTPEKLNELMKPDIVNKAVRDLNNLTAKVLSAVNPKGFSDAIANKNLDKFVDTAFTNAFLKPKEQKMQKTADKADEILTKEKKAKSINGISL